MTARSGPPAPPPRPAPPARSTPPAWARRLLARLLPPGTDGLTIQGDLLEEFHDRAVASGPRAARRWYRRQAIALAVRYAFDPNRQSRTDRLGQLGRDAWRALRRSPGASFAAVGSLGLAIGAATAIFSVVNTVVLRPLPYRDADRLVKLWDVDIQRDLTHQFLSPPTVLDYRALDAAFADVAAWWHPDATLRDAGLDPVRARVVETTGNLFALLGIAPAVGAGFPVDGPLFSADRIAVISDGLWRDRYGADAIAGRVIRLNDDAYRIVGVLPAGFAYPDEADVWTRLAWDPAPLGRGIHIFEGLARLREGVDVRQANRELTGLTERLAADHPDTNDRWRAVATPLKDEVLGYYRLALVAMSGAVALLLLSACLNIASLLLARATTRTRELALRSALGASRGRLIRQLLAESLLLSALATVAGAVSAVVLLRLILPVMPMAVPRLTSVPVDLRLFGFALALMGATALVFGLVPALLATRRAPAGSLAHGGRAATAGGHARWQRALVAAEVALACAVLVAAGLLVRSVDRMTRAASGVDAAGVLTVALEPDGAAYEDWAATARFHAAVVDALRPRAGIDAAGAVGSLPLQSAYRMRFARPDRPDLTEGESVPVQHISVDAGYFEAVRATLVAGRAFAPTDVAGAEPVMVINQTMARLAFGDEPPVGRLVVPEAVVIGPFGYNLNGRVPHRVIGVVADIQQTDLQKPSEPAMYFSVRQFPSKTMYVTARGPGVSVDVLRDAVRSVDPSVPLGRVAWLRDRMLEQSAPARLLMLVLTAFAVLMAVTAAGGLYGLLAWTVSQRRRELAIRQALGATAGALAGRVALQSIGLAVAGIAIGTAAAIVGARGLEGFLFRTERTDPLVLAAAAGVVLIASLLAAVGPARRAGAIAPVTTLRAE